MKLSDTLHALAALSPDEVPQYQLNRKLVENYKPYKRFKKDKNLSPFLGIEPQLLGFTDHIGSNGRTRKTSQ